MVSTCYSWFSFWNKWRDIVQSELETFTNEIFSCFSLTLACASCGQSVLSGGQPQRSRGFEQHASAAAAAGRHRAADGRRRADTRKLVSRGAARRSVRAERGNGADRRTNPRKVVHRNLIKIPTKGISVGVENPEVPEFFGAKFERVNCSICRREL